MIAIFTVLLMQACGSGTQIEGRGSGAVRGPVEDRGPGEGSEFGNGNGNQNRQNVVSPDLQALLDKAGVSGTILVLDERAGLLYGNGFDQADVGSLPASTFKIPNTIIGLETGVASNGDRVFRWDGSPRSLPQWDKDMDLREAFHLSCVPCYQELAREIGPDRMRHFLEKLQYGQMDVQPDNIDEFWLRGNSAISPIQQIDFLERFYYAALPVSSLTTTLMKQLMLIEETPSYRLSGKTGWAIRDGQNTGWFTGYLETGNNVYFFCTRIRPQTAFQMEMFNQIRREITMEALYVLGIISP